MGDMNYRRMKRDEQEEVDVGSDALDRIQERVLNAEEEQLHLRKPHNIIPEIREIIEEEVE